jgi:hypothetical protein
LKVMLLNYNTMNKKWVEFSTHFFQTNFWAARARPAGRGDPLYHSPALLSSKKFNKIFVQFFPKNYLLFFFSCAILQLSRGEKGNPRRALMGKGFNSPWGRSQPRNFLKHLGR